jgi:WbqC-like protein family
LIVLLRQRMKIIELQYLPQPIFFALLLSEKELRIDGYEHYVKQTYRNRCRILTTNGVDELSVPVVKGNKKTLAKDIKLDHPQKWLNKNWRALKTAYGKAPFFEYYEDDIMAVFQRKQVYLFDFNHELLTKCLDFLQFDIKLKFTDQYYDLKDEPQNDFRSKIKPKSNLNINIAYEQVTYQQVFGNEFVGNLSVLDLIFCEGPQAGEIIKSGLIEGTQ